MTYEDKLNELKLKGYDSSNINNVIEYKCSNPECDVVNYGTTFSFYSYTLYGKPKGGCRICKSPIEIKVINEN